MSANLEFSGELPLFPSGWGSGSLSYTGGEAFWAEIERVTSTGGFGESLDGAMLGKAAPRIWLFLHEPGEGKLSASAAMGFARHLVGRGQAVLVLDGDDEDSDLTKWASRQDEEGWLDVVRYGVSLQAAGIPLPFGGRPSYLLGVGSFTPTDATDGEIDRLLARLKRQADDVLVVAPTNSMGYKWAKVSDLRLLCWDRSRLSEGVVDQIAGDFAGTGYPLTSLVGFGFPDKNLSVTMDGRTDLQFEKTESRPSDPVAGPFDEPVEHEGSAFHDEDFEEISSELAEKADNLEVGVKGPAPVYSEYGEGKDDDPVWDRNRDHKSGRTALRPGPWESSSGDVEYATRKGSSKIFGFAIAASVAAIIVVSVYYFQFIHIPTEGNFAPVNSVASLSEGVSQNLNTSQDTPPAREPVTYSDEDMVPDFMPDEAFQVDDAADDPIPEEPEPVVEEKVAVVEPRESGAETIAPAEEKPVVAKVDRKKTFQMDPYLIPVGQEGYALHIYSFADSLDALKQMRELELRGFQTAYRAVEIKGKGRYFRVFLGSFESKRSARAAQDDLLERLHQDWARVARF